ncbi:MAG: O-antigen ligase family protein [Pseudomonadota bacterium]
MTPTGGMPNWHPISLDPSSTIWAALKMAACTMAFLTAQNYLHQRRRRDRLLIIFVIGSTVLAFIGIIGAIAVPGKPLMLYTPQVGRAGGLIATSFVNPNHGAAFLTLGAVVAMGMAVATFDLQRRVLFSLAGIVLGASVFLTLSLGGILALILALGSLSLFLFFGYAQTQTRRTFALIPGVLASIFALAAWLGHQKIVEEFKYLLPGETFTLGKLALWAPGWDMVMANPWVGVGRGAFMTTFPRYLKGDVLLTKSYSHLENQYLHLPAEWGIPIGMGIVLLSFVALIFWIRKGHKDPQTAALASVFLGIAVHNLFDFNMEILGIALPLSVMAGTLSAATKKRTKGKVKSEPQYHLFQHREHQLLARNSALLFLIEFFSFFKLWVFDTRKHHNVMVLGFLGVFSFLGILTAVAPTPTADQDSERIAQLANGPIEEAGHAFSRSIRRHPADYLPHFMAGRIALRKGKPQALAWLNRSMFHFPQNPDIHFETAIALVRFGRPHQALVEYRLALENGTPALRVLRKALPLCQGPKDIERLLPQDPATYVAAIDQLLATNKIEFARAADLTARNHWPSEVDVTAAGIRVLWALEKNEEALNAAKALATAQPIPKTFHIWATAAARFLGKGADIPILFAAKNQFPEDLSFDFALSHALIRAQRLAQALELTEEILKKTPDPQILVGAHTLLAKIHRASGRPYRAQYEDEQAQKIIKNRNIHQR